MSKGVLVVMCVYVYIHVCVRYLPAAELVTPAAPAACGL